MTDKKHGFAALPRERLLEICRKGGQSVPRDKRSFVQNPELARAAGIKGGKSVAGHKRSFSQNRDLAAEAGRKGGHSAQQTHREMRAQEPSA